MLNAGMDDALISALELLPRRFSACVERYACGFAVEEIRLRTGRPIQLVYSDGERLLDSAAFTAKEAAELLDRLCRHSVYAYSEELRSGFVTLESGARVGVCGRPTVENGKIVGLTEITGFNIRIPRQAVGCAENVMRFLQEDGRPISALLASAPGGGKTTLLRDIARCFSDGIGINPCKVAIADERGELAACSGGTPRFDVGARTDVMDRAPKAAAIEMMIRSMSPEVLITDEIGGVGDAEAVSEAVRCGVAVIASAHAKNMEELTSRACTKRLISERVFKKVLLIDRSGSRLRIAPVLL